MIAEQLIERLDSVRATGGDRWIARCGCWSRVIVEQEASGHG
jgi:hypothetical protein